MVNLAGLVAIAVWIVVAIPVSKMAYKKNVADPKHGTAMDIALAVGKGAIWPPYLLGLWLMQYVRKNY